jgi:CheY-like chemotaxis protein
MTIPGGMGGMETLKRLQKIDPNVKAIVSSGHSLEAERSSYFLEGFKGIVEKPYNPAQFSKVLYDVIHAQ